MPPRPPPGCGKCRPEEASSSPPPARATCASLSLGLFSQGSRWRDGVSMSLEAALTPWGLGVGGWLLLRWDAWGTASPPLLPVDRAPVVPPGGNGLHNAPSVTLSHFPLPPLSFLESLSKYPTCPRSLVSGPACRGATPHTRPLAGHRHTLSQAAFPCLTAAHGAGSTLSLSDAHTHKAKRKKPNNPAPRPFATLSILSCSWV